MIILGTPGDAMDFKNVIGGTEGSIPFFDSTGSLTEDNANLFWDNANSGLGIGGSNPTGKLHVSHSGDLGEEKIINGDFTTDSGWAKGAGWEIADGTANCDGSSNNLQPIASIGLTDLTVYRVAYTIKKYISGSIRAKLGNTGFGAIQSGNGIYIEDVTAKVTSFPTLQFNSFGFLGSVDIVSVKEVLSVSPNILVANADGNVGIGTATPLALLDVNGDALINGMTVGTKSSDNVVLGEDALDSITKIGRAHV